jgi:hypothetical protein
MMTLKRQRNDPYLFHKSTNSKLSVTLQPSIQKALGIFRPVKKLHGNGMMGKEFILLGVFDGLHIITKSLSNYQKRNGVVCAPLNHCFQMNTLVKQLGSG